MTAPTLLLRASAPARMWSLVAILAAALAGGTGCRPPAPEGYQGYLEGDLVHIGAPVPGLLVRRTVDRGAEVGAGDLLFVLESRAEEAAVAEAERRETQARARLENLRKGRRPTELAALEARVAQTRAELELADQELERRRRLVRDEVVSQSELDAAVARRQSADALAAAARADLETARLGGREDEIAAAAAEQEAAAANLARAKWAVEQKTQRAPAAGRVHDTFREPGEFVAAGTPVLALLPSDRIKVRFFVPQSELARVPAGTAVRVSRDGAEAPLTARVSYVAPGPEFTPPVIYSRASRAKLVFLVEAAFAPEAAVGLHPGQPVEVRLAPPTP